MSPLHRAQSIARGLLPAVALSCCLNGCAVLNRENTPALNLVEENLWPESTGLRIAVAPVVFPAGLVAVTVDAVIVHPASVIVDAAGDTGDALWERWNWSEQYLTECTALPWRAIGTPVVFASVFTIRAMFDVPRRAEEERDKKEKAKSGGRAPPDLEPGVEEATAALAAARTKLNEGKPSEALDRGLEALYTCRAYDMDPDRPLMRQVGETILDAAHRSGRHETLLRRDVMIAVRSLRGRSESILESMQSAASPFVRWTALQVCFGYDARIVFDSPRPRFLRRGLRDRSPLVRYAALEVLDASRHLDGATGFIPDLESLIESDPDPVIRARAEQVRQSITR